MSGLLENHQSGSLRSLRMLKPYGWWLGLVVGLLLLLTFVDMAAPYFLKLLIDDVFPQGTGGGNTHLLWLILPGIVVSYVARNALFYKSRMRALRISEDLCFDLRKRLYDHMQRLSLRFYRSHQPGRLSARLMDDTFKIQSFIQDKFPMLIRYVLEFQVLLIIIYVVNWRLAIASTIVLPLHLAASYYFRGSIRKSHSEAQETLARAHGNIVEKFLGMEVVKGFGAEERESRTFREAIDASRKSQIRSQRYHFSQKVAADLLVGAGTVLLLGYGTWNVITGHMKSGEFLMFFLYVRMLYPAVLEIISGTGHLSKATASVDRVFEMLAEPTDEDSPDIIPDPVQSDALTGHIEYQGVSFKYGEDSTAVLQDINLTIAPGEHVAVTGPSGSGKTTLISLLPRFNDPSSGQVLIDGLSLDTIPIPTLRSLFGIVFQEVFLFNASIYENLRYARPDAGLEDMIEACKITGAHDFIQRLPDGYYTKLGSDGGELSRGERQRITLARALVRDPKILIIDEATASIDTSAARGIIQSILRHMQGRTVIMVTHDIELLDLVNRIITIEQGKVVYDGYVTPQVTAPAKAAPTPVEKTQPATPERIRERLSKALRTKPGPLGPIAGMLVLCMLWANGCTAKVNSKQTIALEEPRLSQGVILDEDDPNQLKQLAEALDNIALQPLGSTLSSSEPNEAPGPVRDTNQPAEADAPAPDRIDVTEAVAMAPVPSTPSKTARLIALPKLSNTEITDIADRLELYLITTLGYQRTSDVIADALPAAPRGLFGSRTLARSTEDGDSVYVLRFGFRRYVSQPPQCWVQGVIVTDDTEALAANPDLEKIEPEMTGQLAALDEMRQGLTVRDLETKLVQLSYVDAPTAVSMLKGMGFTTMNQPTDVPETVDFTKLPYVVIIPDPAKEDTGLIGTGTEVAGGTMGLSLTPGVASEITSNTIASPMTQLMVMFHPAHPQQFSNVRQSLDTFIDRPARQIFIEAMVLEISEQGLKELGIQWELNNSPLTITGGALTAGTSTDTLDIEISNTSLLHNIFEGDYQWDWSAKIRALVRTGKAEVLSRPSVLTLNNRQSTIRVGQDVPIASSYEGLYSSSNKVAFSFKYLPTGILLNIRPRINEQGTEVSMLIDTIVSAEVPNEDLELLASDGIQVLASAPTVSTRRVQTYGRIRNNTPFIIGGLVSRKNTVTYDKIPLLGDLPLVGFAFRAEKNELTKTEVIIVLTPYILPEKKLIPRSLPKDEDLFDSFGHHLFRDSYRIRTEDVFDLTFLLENPRIVIYRDMAHRVVDKDFRYGEMDPFRSFVRDDIPGESILVTRMIYEVIKRLELAEPVKTSRIIYLESQQVGGYNVNFLQTLLQEYSDGSFQDLGDKAVAVIFTRDSESTAGDEGLGGEPIPEIRLVDCPDREAWGETLWQLNQPAPDGRRRHAILIQNREDLLRLRRALVLKKIVVLNGGVDQMRLRNFSVGKVLLMPDLKGDQIHLADADAAMFFFHTEHYYAATLAEIESQLTELDQLLRRPEINALLDTDATD